MVERDGLENRCTRQRIEGSNPSPSASQDNIGGKKHSIIGIKIMGKKLDALLQDMGNGVATVIMDKEASCILQRKNH